MITVVPAGTFCGPFLTHFFPRELPRPPTVQRIVFRSPPWTEADLLSDSLGLLGLPGLQLVRSGKPARSVVGAHQVVPLSAPWLRSRHTSVRRTPLATGQAAPGCGRPLVAHATDERPHQKSIQRGLSSVIPCAEMVAPATATSKKRAGAAPAYPVPRLPNEPSREEDSPRLRSRSLGAQPSLPPMEQLVASNGCDLNSRLMSPSVRSASQVRYRLW